MGLLRYSINITLDGCGDHRVSIPAEDLHLNAANALARAEALLFGRVTYQLMEDGWRDPSPEMPDWTIPFADVITEKKKYVVSSTLDEVDWNGAELLRGDLETEVRRLKSEMTGDLFVGGITLPLALANMGLIDEYEFVVHPKLVGHGPTVFEGLTQVVDLKLVDQVEFSRGVIALRYEQVPRD